MNFILRNLNYDIAQRSRPFTVEGWSVLIYISSEVGKWNLDNVDLAHMSTLHPSTVNGLDL